ncbi:MAG: sensor histidine kinase [Lachnospiraceae bacterium]
MKEKKGLFGRISGFVISVLLIAAVSAAVVYFYPAMMSEAKKVHGYYTEYEAMLSDYLLVVGSAIVVVVLLGLLLPFIKPFGLKRGLKANLPLELLCIIVPCILVFIAEEMPYQIIDVMRLTEGTELVGDWRGMLKEFMTREREISLIYAANGLTWFAVLSIVYVCVLSIRQIFSKGLVRYAKENTLIGIAVCFVWRKGSEFVKSVQNIDFTEKGNRIIGRAVLINFIAIVLLCCMWAVAIPIAILYSLFLLIAGTKVWKKIKGQYDTLLAETEQMADGRTDIAYAQDAGVFQDLQEELKKVQSGFEKAVKEEVKSERMKTELITNVSHDLKTPLTAIIAYVDLLKNENLGEEERQTYIQVLEQKSARLKTLIEDLFEVSKASTGNICIEPETLDLTALLKEVQVELEDKIMQSGIEFKMTAPEEKVLVLLDGQKTCRIFENLFGNILKYGMPGSRAYIAIETVSGMARVTLKNISAAELNFDTNEITERFVRGDASRTTEGSGLGLAIAKSLAEAQGGSLSIQTDGDLFKAMVEFPLLTEHAEKAVMPEEAEKTATETADAEESIAGKTETEE